MPVRRRRMQPAGGRTQGTERPEPKRRAASGASPPNTPLWPAGHLPLKGGDCLSPQFSPNRRLCKKERDRPSCRSPPLRGRCPAGQRGVPRTEGSVDKNPHPLQQNQTLTKFSPAISPPLTATLYSPPIASTGSSVRTGHSRGGDGFRVGRAAVAWLGDEPLGPGPYRACGRETAAPRRASDRRGADAAPRIV